MSTLPRIAAALALLTFSPLAIAQSTVFQDTFEAGMAGWVTSGDPTYRWHLVDESSSCMTDTTPFPTSGQALYAGSSSSCNFDFGYGVVMNLTSAAPISLPAAASDLQLSFWSYDDVECGSCGWDWRFVYISADGGTTWDFLGESDRLLQWYQVAFDITAYAGQDVLLRFSFDAVDFWFNDGLGWVIDSVRITEGWGTPSNYCGAAPSSVSATGARMGWSGTTSIAQDDFQLTLSEATPSQFAHFFYGPGRAYTPVADGFLCVRLGATGIVRLLPAGQIDANGDMARELDIAATQSGPAWVTTGSTWYFQCWYRDPGGPGGTGSNFSDGLRVTFAM